MSRQGQSWRFPKKTSELLRYSIIIVKQKYNLYKLNFVREESSK